jgi:hypothetical protein
MEAAKKAVAVAQQKVVAAQAALNSLVAAAAKAKTMSQRLRYKAAIAAAQATLQKEQQGLAAAQAALLKLSVAAPAPASAPLPTLVITDPPPPQGLIRVLTIGINYVATPYELAGCINDATNMAEQTRHFFPACRDYRLITDNTPEKPTKANILAAIDWLVSGLKPGQNVMFHFAGHGGRVRDTNGDEMSGYDSCLYPLNGRTLEVLTDDELRVVLAERVPAGSKCFVVLDCCHSGTAVDLRYKWQAPAAGTMTYTEDQNYAKTTGDILFLSGCRDMETAADTVSKEGRPCGAMTMALLETWRAYGAAIKLKYLLWDVRKFLGDNGYTQVPEITTGSWMDMNAVWDLGKA